MDEAGTDLVVDAGLTEVRISRSDLELFARETGRSEDPIVLFRGVGGSQPVTARRP